MAYSLERVTTTRIEIQKRHEAFMKSFFGEGPTPGVALEDLSEIRRMEFDHKIDVFVRQCKNLEDSGVFLTFVSELMIRFSVMRFDDLAEQMRVASQAGDLTPLQAPMYAPYNPADQPPTAPTDPQYG